MSNSRRVPSRPLRELIYQERFGWILSILIVGYLIESIFDGPVASIFLTVAWVTLVLAALAAPGIPTALRLGGLVLSVALLVAATFFAIDQSDTANAVMFLMLSAIQFVSLLAILIRVLQHKQVGPATIMGAIAAYFLIALTMAPLYHGLDILGGGDFLNGASGNADYLYFSIVTVTTLGYGDVTPATETAKSLAGIEALAGQMFLVTLLARLVSLWGNPLRQNRPRPGDETTSFSDQ